MNGTIKEIFEGAVEETVKMVKERFGRELTREEAVFLAGATTGSLSLGKLLGMHDALASGLTTQVEEGLVEGVMFMTDAKDLS
jgi:hypothetical protein